MHLHRYTGSPSVKIQKADLFYRKSFQYLH